jgi:hypothetical protein
MLTIALWLFSFICIAISISKTKHWNDKIMRVVFSLLVGLSFWITSVYVFWLMGFDLQVGTIENGKMHEQWWLPSVVIFWTVLAYYVSKK